MKYLILIFAITSFANTSFAQEDAKEETKSEEEAKSAEETKSKEAKRAEETPEQVYTRSISLEDLAEADENLMKERERWAKSERRLNDLMEALNNSSAEIEDKTESLQRILDENKTPDKGAAPTISQVQIDHWNNRDPAVAARDFVLLYGGEPEVAVGIVKGMKKKKSAALIDAVSALDAKGRGVAARLHEAIGTGQVKSKK